MSFVHTFTDITPPARADGVSWTLLLPEESSSPSGPWLALTSVAVAADPSPETPLAADYTLTDASLDSGYFRFAFADGAANQSAFSAPVFSPSGATGTPLCTIEQIDAELNRAGDASSYSEAVKLDARDAASAAFEREAGVAFSPRTTTAVLRAVGRGPVLLPNARVTAVTAVSGLTVDEVAALYVDAGAVFGFSYPVTPLTVTYTHGYEATPADVSRAVAVLAGSILKDGPYDDRGYGVTEDGSSVRLLTAGVGSASFSIPDVQAALSRYKVVFAL